MVSKLSQARRLAGADEACILNSYTSSVTFERRGIRNILNTRFSGTTIQTYFFRIVNIFERALIIWGEESNIVDSNLRPDVLGNFFFVPDWV